MFKYWSRSSGQKSPHRMAGAQLICEEPRLAARSHAMSRAVDVLPVAGIVCGTASFCGMAVVGLCLPATSVLSICALLAGGAAVVGWLAAANQGLKMADRLKPIYDQRLEKLRAEQQRRAGRSPALLSMTRETRNAKKIWRSNVLVAAAEAAFREGTDKSMTIRPPLKLASPPSMPS